MKTDATAAQRVVTHRAIYVGTLKEVPTPIWRKQRWTKKRIDAKVAHLAKKIRAEYAERHAAGLSANDGNPALHDFLTLWRDSTDYETVEASLLPAFWRLMGKAYTGKDGAHPTDEDSLLVAASDDTLLGQVMTWWAELGCPGGRRFLRRVGAIKRKRLLFDDELEADHRLIALWGNNGGQPIPPLCFFTDQAAADHLSDSLNGTFSSDQFRQWRRRWGIKKSRYTLIKKFIRKTW